MFMSKYSEIKYIESKSQILILRAIFLAAILIFFDKKVRKVGLAMRSIPKGHRLAADILENSSVIFVSLCAPSDIFFIKQVIMMIIINFADKYLKSSKCYQFATN